MNTIIETLQYFVLITIELIALIYRKKKYANGCPVPECSVMLWRQDSEP